ncbi:hypothetical protein [Saccharibacillus kuerlensis]|uniref:Uncharacterized protein n=1 Tax=Saccharibacillus kuerlensis TaxID=459527 RepID=A0ABQ2L701_9BACL|nr:hypothetical protein [Saccharibacillus kuerlensis]GGO03387.1 hypothetical protein GCM10010969_27610 [Saccharibacillus kuerlensis]
MKKIGRWKNPWLIVIACLLIASAAFNFTLFTAARENSLAANGSIREVMRLIKSADSQLNGAIQSIEGGAGAAESLSKVAQVRVRLTEAAGLLGGVRQEASRYIDEMRFYNLTDTLRLFDRHLESEVTAGWQEGDAALDASREQALIELRSMKLDLAQLADLSRDPNHDFYDVKDLVQRWESAIRQRVQEDPNTKLHQELSWRYGL